MSIVVDIEAILGTTDRVEPRLGGEGVTVTVGAAVTVQMSTGPTVGLVCTGLTVRYRGRSEPTIRDVAFTLPDGGLVAVVGPSGSGKSTLCAAMLGEVEDVRGRVVLDGVDLLASQALARRLVSFVPQRDALHNELTPRRALALTAELRLAPRVDAADRERRINEVLVLLELLEHAEKRIGELSGGQRKRVAVAMELLSDPRLLMLDEPTSGLDEGLDLVMMQLLRRIADGGRSVIVVTHSTANLDFADTVLALDVEGRVAYAGPPRELLETFGVATYAQAMHALRSGPTRRGPFHSGSVAGDTPSRGTRSRATPPRGTAYRDTSSRATPPTGTAYGDTSEGWLEASDADRQALAGTTSEELKARAHARTAAAIDVLPRPDPVRPPRHARRSARAAAAAAGAVGDGAVGDGAVNDGAVADRAVETVHPQSLKLGHSTWVLLRRELARMFANPLTLARGTVLLPLLSCVLTAWAADRGLAWTAADPNRMQGAAMSVLITCITFFAMALSFSTIVGDRDVIEREHRWGVPPVAVVGSKAIALLGPILAQAVVTYVTYAAVRPGPDRVVAGLPSWLVLPAALAMLGISSMALGLLVSASSRTLERAIFLLMGCIAVLVVLTGLLIPLGNPEGVGGNVLATIAQLAPTRWGTAAIAAYIGYIPNEAVNPGGGNADGLWVQDSTHVATAMISLFVLALVYTLSAAHLLVVQSRRRR